MDLHQKIRTLPAQPGVYLYKNAEGEVIYVGKAKSLRARVRSYFVEGAALDTKTGSLLREAVDVDYIIVANEKEALALENNLIKQKRPRFNILLRDDKTYPYIKLASYERSPRVYVTRRLKKDGSEYFGPYFPGNLAHRLVDVIHRSFLIPSCKVDLTRFHARPCLQYYIKRCLGPCVQNLTTPEIYQEAVRDVRLFLQGKTTELSQSLELRMTQAAAAEQFELAAKYRDLLSTVHQSSERQRMAAAEGDDSDVIGYHFENDMLAVNVFHLRGGKIVDRREFYWEELPQSEPVIPEEEAAPQPASAIAPRFVPSRFVSTFVQQLYIGQNYVPKQIFVPVDFEERSAMEELLSETRGNKVEIAVPQRGERRSLIDLAAQNAKQCFDQRFRVLKPQRNIIQESLRDTFELPDIPKRIECFDISHIQGAETVASMVVWEDGKMRPSEYRKFIIRGVIGVDDFASMREVVSRRYARVLKEEKPMPSLVLIDGGIGQLHSAAQSLEALAIVNQPLAAIAKREELIYLFGQESEPIRLDRHSPVLHVIQQLRDEAHRFAVTFHRKRRQMRDRANELLEIPGIGSTTMRRLLEHFGSVRAVKEAPGEALAAVVNQKQATAIQEYFRSLHNQA